MIVVDTGPLSAFARIERLDLLRQVNRFIHRKKQRGLGINLAKKGTFKPERPAGDRATWYGHSNVLIQNTLGHSQ